MKWLLRSLIVALGVAAVVGAYYYGKKQITDINVDLLAELEAMKASEADAAVVKRVSQQMEDIAYQQKSISDKQRDRAEQQSVLALEMRRMAEKESQSARKAEQRAVEAAREAAQAAREAGEQRDEADRVRRISDTLTYRTLGRTLGNSAVKNYESGHQEIGEMLAYTSWYFLHKYQGNEYQSESFKAVSTCAGSRFSLYLPHGGAVTGLEVMPNGKLIAVSDYGEVESIDLVSSEVNVLFHDKSLNFCSVKEVNGCIYALTTAGVLYLFEDGKTESIAMQEGAYFRMIRETDNTLLIASRKNVCRFDVRHQAVLVALDLPRKLSEIIMWRNRICLFYADGSYAEIDENGELQEKSPLVSGTVSTAVVDATMGSLFLGRDDGNIEMIDCQGQKKTTLIAHTAKITDMVACGDILVSGSYDKMVYIWNLPKLQISDVNNVGEVVKHVDGKKKDTTLTEWLTPADYVVEGWPFVVERLNETDVVVGTSKGQVLRLNVLVDNMAEKIKHNMKRNFTQEEWSHYIGNNIPYVQLLEQ